MSSSSRLLAQNLAELLEDKTGGGVTIRIEPPRGGARPKSRQGKKMIAGHFSPDAAWQLRKLAHDKQATVQTLLEEALGDLFEKYHLPRV
jgi:hypothetical protein